MKIKTFLKSIKKTLPNIFSNAYIKFNKSANITNDKNLIKNEEKMNDKSLDKLEIAEFILDYTHGFPSKYMLYDGLVEWIKSMNVEKRMWYIINVCNKSNPTPQENFLLAMAYNNLKTLYNEYAIYYAELYLKNNKFYNKKFKNRSAKEENICYQRRIFHYILANKYEKDLNLKLALENAYLMAFNKPNYNYAVFNDEYTLLARLLYKNGNLTEAIGWLRKGIEENNGNDYLRNEYFSQIKKYQEYQKNNKIYIPKKIKRLRISIKENFIYDITTGEIIDKKSTNF